MAADSHVVPNGAEQAVKREGVNELIHRQGPWRGLDDVEFATMSYIDWFNNRRLHGTITDGPGYTTPQPTKPLTTVR
jgi:hypothetical protein